MSGIPAIHDWPSNSHLIADVAKIWLRPEDRILDVTYGLGNFWQLWKPGPEGQLLGADLNPNKSMIGAVDFRYLPWGPLSWPVVVFDPPYKLNGTPDGDVDARYGVEAPTRWQDRMKLIEDGARECARVSSDRVLVKVQDQVCSGKMRWQTDLVTDAMRGAGFRKADRFDMIGHERPQPKGRRQAHARGRGSTLLVFARGR